MSTWDRDLELIDACERGDVEYLRRAAASGVALKTVVTTNYWNGTLLHTASRNGHLDIVKYLVDGGHCQPNSMDDYGRTTLHYAARSGHLEVVRFLVDGGHCQPNSENSGGETALHVAAAEGQLEVVRFLVDGGHCQPNSKNNSGATALHWAAVNGHLDVVQYLVDGGHCQPNFKDEDGETALHWAVADGHLDVVRFLVDGGHCQPNSKDSDGWTPLHDAAWEGHLDVVRFLVDEGHCLPNSKNDYGKTALHYAVDSGSTSVTSYLLQHGECDPNSVTNSGQTPLSLTNDPSLIRILLVHGAKPTSRVPSHLQDTTADAATNMFIVGNPGAGKSTFIKSFSTSGNAFTRIKHRFAKVTAVQEKTAGIIPCDVEVRGLGRVTAYDFAGHREFYAGHDALLQNSMRGSASIVLLVINMSEEESKIKEATRYWVQFISNHTSESGPKTHLVIIGSHAEGLSSREVKSKANLIKSVVNSHNLCGITFAGLVVTDCRYAESSSMSRLRSIISQSCKSIRSQEKISTAQHSLLVFLLDRFKNEAAVTYGQVSEALRESIGDDDHTYLECIKSSDPLELCDELSKRGNILFMKNQACLENSWIVFDKASLLSQVNGVIFAPEGFKEHQHISSRSGLVPHSKLVSLFPNLNADMITQFLCHLEFCHEVTDEDVLSLLHHTQNTSAEKERLLFFPGLVDLDIPANILQPNDKFVYHSGWLFKCSKPEQFFSLRFLQVLFLRLAYSLAFAPCIVVDRILPRNIQVWKCGISWKSTSGIEVVVQVIDQKQVMVIIRGFNSSMTEFLRTRSAIIGKVLDAKQSLCPAVEVEEKFLRPEIITAFPVDVATPSKAVRIDAVAQSVVEAGVAVVDEAGKMMKLNSLLYFEPYANHGLDILESLFRSDAPDQTTDPSVDNITKRLHENIDRAMAALGLPSEEVSKLHHEICCPEPDMKGLRYRLDQHSVFSGRSPLDLCTNKVVSGPRSKVSTTSNVDPSDARVSDSSTDKVVLGAKNDVSTTSKALHVDHSDSRSSGISTVYSEVVQSQNLTLIRWRDDQGRIRRFYLMDNISYKWRIVGELLGLPFPKLESIAMEHRDKPENCCRSVVLGQWLDNPPPRYPTTWQGLLELLEDSKLGEVATQLRTALENKADS